MLSTHALREFCAVATHLSFVRAAGSLNLHPSVLSRRIKELEATLGAPLFHRHTRSVSLTEAGSTLLPHAQDLLSRLGDAEALVAQFSSEPAGVLRLSLPTSFGQIAIGPLLAEFRCLYPAIDLEVALSDRYLDLIEHGFDAAIRIGARAAGAGLRTRTLAQNHRYLCAAPDYLAGRDHLRTPDDLVAHDLLHFSPLATGPVWRLQGPNGAMDVPVKPAIAADNALMLRRAVLDGAGIALLADFLVADDLAHGRLVEVLPAYRPQPGIVSIVFPERPILARKTRVFIDFLARRWTSAGPGDRTA